MQIKNEIISSKSNYKSKITFKCCDSKPAYNYKKQPNARITISLLESYPCNEENKSIIKILQLEYSFKTYVKFSILFGIFEAFNARSLSRTIIR